MTPGSRKGTGKNLRIAALAGGVGGSKLLLGLQDVLADPASLTAIINTGDDIILHGINISPDLDIVTYTLAGIVDTAKGWGLRRETFHALQHFRGKSTSRAGGSSVADFHNWFSPPRLCPWAPEREPDAFQGSVPV